MPKSKVIYLLSFIILFYNTFSMKYDQKQLEKAIKKQNLLQVQEILDSTDNLKYNAASEKACFLYAKIYGNLDDVRRENNELAKIIVALFDKDNAVMKAKSHQKQLYRAIKESNFSKAKKLIKNSNDIILDEALERALEELKHLYWDSYSEDNLEDCDELDELKDIIKLLVAKGADVNKVEKYGESYLHKYLEYPEIIYLLLNVPGINLFFKNPQNETALEEVDTKLLNFYCKKWERRLYNTSKSQFRAYAKSARLIAKAIMQKQICTVKELQVILYAIKTGDLENTKKLIIKHIRFALRYKDQYGNTLLHWCVENYQQEMVRLIYSILYYLRHVKNNSNNTPIELAANLGHKYLIAFLPEQTLNK